MQIIDYFNYILICVGLHLCPTTRYVRLCNNTIRIVTIILLLFSIAITTLQFVEEFNAPNIEAIVNFLIIGYFPYQYMTKLQSIQQLCHRIDRLLNKSDLAHLRKLSFYYVVAIALVQIVWYVKAVNDWYGIIAATKDYSWMDDDIPTTLRANKAAATALWIVKVSFHYTTSFVADFMYVMYLLLVQALIRVQARFLEKLDVEMSLAWASNTWSEIKETRFEFEQLFTMYPLLKFMSTFVWTTTYVVGIYQGIIEEKLFAITIWALATCLTFSVLFVIDNGNVEFERSCIRFREKIKSTKSQKLRDFADDVSANLHLKLTAYGMFDLNKSVILSFVSAIVSFSVLFLQWVK